MTKTIRFPSAMLFLKKSSKTSLAVFDTEPVQIYVTLDRKLSAMKPFSDCAIDLIPGTFDIFGCVRNDKPFAGLNQFFQLAQDFRFRVVRRTEVDDAWVGRFGANVSRQSYDVRHGLFKNSLVFFGICSVRR